MTKKYIKLLWTNLKDGRCPKCSSLLKDENDFNKICSSEKCDFKISKFKMERIKEKITSVKIKEID